MANLKTEFLHADLPASGVERAANIAKQIFYSARGNYESDQQCIDAIARRERLSPSVFRRLLQPSRRPKEVGLTVWSRLCAAYRRQLERQLAQLTDEIDRLEYLEPSDAAVRRLLDDAQALTRKIAAFAGEISPPKA